MSRAVEERIGAAAARQHGVVTRGQLVEAGLSASAIARRLASGRLRALHYGVYLVGPLEPPGAPAMAAVLASGPGAVVSHLTAASLWGMRAPDSPAAGRRLAEPGRRVAEPVDVTIADGNRGRRPGIRLHRAVRLEAEDRTARDGIPITTPGRTLVDVAGRVGTRELEAAVLG